MGVINIPPPPSPPPSTTIPSLCRGLDFDLWREGGIFNLCGAVKSRVDSEEGRDRVSGEGRKGEGMREGGRERERRGEREGGRRRRGEKGGRERG